MSTGGARARAQHSKLVGITAYKERFSQYPHELSGGMRQRVMIAIALVCKPSVLIADEPTTALDVTIQAQILSLITKLKEETGASIILITHDLAVVSETCDRVIVMYLGQIVEEADAREIFSNPKHLYTKGLMQSIPQMTGETRVPLRDPGHRPLLNQIGQGCRFADRCEYVCERCRKENAAGCGSWKKWTHGRDSSLAQGVEA
ncbi:MAG: ABC transporter ATP-binding protein [Acutalibacteraceae bacterium]